MFTGLAMILLAGMGGAYLFEKLKLPGLIGMMLAGIAIGPCALDLLGDGIMLIAPDLRELALVVILARAGLALNMGELRKVGRPAFLMSWVPAAFEIAGILIFATLLLKVSLLEAAIIGAVTAAVSPAVVVPRMLGLMERGYGAKKSIPQLIMAGASVDNIVVILLFSVFLALAAGGDSAKSCLWQVPLSVLTGIIGGVGAGGCLGRWFAHFQLRDTVKMLIFLSVAFLAIAFGKLGIIPFSGLFAVICMGITILRMNVNIARGLSEKFRKLWVGAEVILFVLVGAEIDVRYALAAGAMITVVVTGALLFRMAGVGCSLLGSKLNRGERLFCAAAYIPKATVQAAIGSVPLAMGLACGQIALAVAVVSILLTAPLGAFLIDYLYPKLLDT